MATNDAWLEKCLIAITKQSGSDINFQGLTSSVDIDLGTKDITQIDLIGGPCTIEYVPETLTTVTLEAYPVESGTDTGTTGKGFFDLLHTNDTTQPVQISGSKDRFKIRIAMLWTDDTTVTSATSQIASGNAAMRLAFADGFVISVKPSFTDGVLKFTITLKVPAHDNSNSTNIRLESVDGTSTLTALSAYTSAVKGW